MTLLRRFRPGSMVDATVPPPVRVEPIAPLAQAACAEMSSLLEQSVQVVEALETRCAAAEAGRAEAEAALRAALYRIAHFETALKQTEAQLRVVLENERQHVAARETLRIAHAAEEQATLAKIDLLQRRLDDLDEMAKLRWRSLDFSDASIQEADEAVLDLLQMPAGRPLADRRAA